MPCLPSLDDLAEAVDAVVVATPADTVPGILDSAGRIGCGGASRLRRRVRRNRSHRPPGSADRGRLDATRSRSSGRMPTV